MIKENEIYRIARELALEVKTLELVDKNKLEIGSKCDNTATIEFTEDNNYKLSIDNPYSDNDEFVIIFKNRVSLEDYIENNL